MGEEKKEAAARRKAKAARDKRAKGKEGLGRLFNGGYYMTNQKGDADN